MEYILQLIRRPCTPFLFEKVLSITLNRIIYFVFFSQTPISNIACLANVYKVLFLKLIV